MYIQKPTPNNHFLCNKYKERLTNDPEQALTAWIKLINSGRQKAMKQDWQEAVILYGYAFEVAQLIFLGSPEKTETKRYIRTAVEFMFSLRHSDYPADYNLLIMAIRGCLETTLSPDGAKKSVEPLMDIAFSPICEVSRWMEIFYATESHYGKTIH
jgi:hypothetical protein